MRPTLPLSHQPNSVIDHGATRRPEGRTKPKERTPGRRPGLACILECTPCAVGPSGWPARCPAGSDVHVARRQPTAPRHRPHAAHDRRSPFPESISPFSCFRRFRLLHIFTAHIERMIATIKNSMPPTTPAVMALCLTRAGTGNLTSSLLS